MQMPGKHHELLQRYLCCHSLGRCGENKHTWYALDNQDGLRLWSLSSYTEFGIALKPGLLVSTPEGVSVKTFSYLHYPNCWC